MSCHKRQYVEEMAEALKKAGYRVFLAKRGTHGCFTNTEGSKVVSFQMEILSISFFGNYQTSGLNSGNGWGIREGHPDLTKGEIDKIFNDIPGHWAHGGSSWRYTTLKEHLKMYSASEYKELI